MTESEINKINIAIAGACGWSLLNNADHPKVKTIYGYGPKQPCGDLVLEECPNYCHDLNAMHEAEAMITVGEIGRHLSALSEVVQPLSTYHPMDLQWFTVRATALQRAEAFLRVKGLWNDERPTV